MRLTQVTAPISEPISLIEAKAHCRVDGTDDDTLIGLYIQAARAKAENYTGSAIITQVWDQSIDEFPEAEIELTKPPVTSITSVTYIDESGVAVVMPSTDYTLDTTYPCWLLPAVAADWPTTRDQANAVTIRYVTGYSHPAVVPGDIRAWLLLSVGYLWAQRESHDVSGRVAEIPGNFMRSLLDPYRVFKL